MFIRDSRRSYGTYAYAELTLITDLCSFGTPVGVTELMLMLWSSNLFGGTHRYHRESTERKLVLRNLFLYFGYGSTCRYYITFYLCKSTRRYYRTDSLYGGTRRYHWTYTYLTDTGVLVGSTELVLILLIQEYP